jgi:hypothetical protein
MLASWLKAAVVKGLKNRRAKKHFQRCKKMNKCVLNSDADINPRTRRGRMIPSPF